MEPRAWLSHWLEWSNCCEHLHLLAAGCFQRSSSVFRLLLWDFSLLCLTTAVSGLILLRLSWKTSSWARLNSSWISMETCSGWRKADALLSSARPINNSCRIRTRNYAAIFFSESANFCSSKRIFCRSGLQWMQHAWSVDWSSSYIASIVRLGSLLEWTDSRR